jgi:vacuolar-type H+-ATPase subunit C/Vma6
MNITSRDSFILAKIYGKMAKTYIGANFRDLLRLKRLEEIFDVLFPGERTAAPVEPLSADLETRIMRAAIKTMTDILFLTGDTPEILVHILRKFEYQSLKSVIRSLVREGADKPVVWDLGKYALLRTAKGVSFEKAISLSAYAWVLPLIRSKPLFEIENMLDRDYYHRLQELARRLPMRDRSGVLRLVTLEVALTNVIWALRLRFFFGMDSHAAEPLMIPGTAQTHRKAMLEAFEIPADSVEGWRRWKYSWLVEDQLGEAFRAPDPVRAEQKAARRMALKAHQLFHEDPFTLTPVVAFFKLKELETGMLKIAVEALRLSVPDAEVLSMLGAD